MNLQLKRNNSIEERVLFAYGFLGTMPILELFGFTAFTWMTAIVVMYVIAKSGVKWQVSETSKYFVILSAFMIFSSLVGLVSEMPMFWKKQGITNMIWQLLYVVIIVYFLDKDKYQKCLFYVKGVYYSSIFHCVWGVLQLFIYRFTDISINKVIFYDFLGVEQAEFVQMRGGSIAMTGFCWNAGNLAPIVIIGYVMSTSIYLKFFFIFVAAISGSRTLVLGIVACVCLQMFIEILLKHKEKVKKTYILAAFVVIMTVVFGLTQKSLMDSIYGRIREITNTFSFDFLQTQASSRVHARYWTTIPQITGWNSFLHNLFGYGIGCSGYPFAVLLNQYSDHAWTVECDYINNLWGIGYVGFILWYSWYFLNIVRSTRIDKKYLVLFVGLLIEGVTYNVTFNWCYIMLIMIFGLIKLRINVFEKGNELCKCRLKNEII